MIRKAVAAIVILTIPFLILRSSRANPTPTVKSSSASSDGGTAARSCGSETITGDGVGRLLIGESVDSVKSRCTVRRDTTQRGLEGMTERRIVVDFQSDTLEAEIVDGKVWRLDIRSQSFRTADSLGVGTSLARVLTLGGVHGLVGEGVLVAVSPERCGLSFVLSGGIPSGRMGNWDKTALSTLPSSTKVQKILVVGCRASGGSAATAPQ